MTSLSSTTFTKCVAAMLANAAADLYVFGKDITDNPPPFLFTSNTPGGWYIAIFYPFYIYISIVHLF